MTIPRGYARDDITRCTSAPRPIYVRAAKDNLASLRVLAKCGFKICAQDKGFANARGREVEEFILKLETDENSKTHR